MVVTENRDSVTEPDCRFKALCMYVGSTIHLQFFKNLGRVHLTLVFIFGHVARRILVPQPGIEPTSPAVEVWILNHWPTKEVPGMGWDSHSFLVLDVLIRAEYSVSSNFGGKFAGLPIRVTNAAQALR